MSAFWPVWLGSSSTNPLGTYVAGTVGTGWDASTNSNVLRQTYINGFLDVSATSTFRYDVSMNGNLFIAPGKRSYFGGDVSFGNRLFVVQDVSLNSNLYVQNRSVLNGDISLNSRLFIGQDASLNGNLYVQSRSILNGDVSMNSRLFVAQDTSLNGNLYVQNRSILNGDISLNGRLLVVQDASLNGNLYVNRKSIVNGDISLNSRLFVGQDASFNGNLYVNGKSIVNGDISLNGNLFIYGNISVQQLQNASVINTTVSSYQLIVSEDISLNGRLLISRDASFGGNLVLTGTGTTGRLGIGITPIYTLDVSGQINSRNSLTINNTGYNQYGTASAYPTNRFNTIAAGDGVNAIVNGNGGVYVAGQGLTLTGQSLYWGAATPTAPSSYASQIQIDGGRSPNAVTSHGQIRFYTANNQRAVIDEDGDVGIGTSSPLYNLTLANPSTDTFPRIAIQDTTNARYACGIGFSDAVKMNFFCGEAASNTSQLTNSHIRMTINSSGNVGIGTTSPAYSLDVNGTIRSSSVFTSPTDLRLFSANNGSANTNTIYMAGQTYSFLNGNQSATYGVWNSSGYLGVGTTSPAYPLQVNGQAAATSFNATSDYRIKENVQPLDESFTVDNIKPVSFTNTLLNRQDIGMLAHEVQEEYPYLVTGEKDGKDNQTVNYIGFIGLLIHEVKQIKEQMQKMQAEIETLKSNQ